MAEGGGGGGGNDGENPLDAPVVTPDEPLHGFFAWMQGAFSQNAVRRHPVTNEVLLPFVRNAFLSWFVNHPPDAIVAGTNEAIAYVQHLEINHLPIWFGDAQELNASFPDSRPGRGGYYTYHGFFENHVLVYMHSSAFVDSTGARLERIMSESGETIYHGHPAIRYITVQYLSEDGEFIITETVQVVVVAVPRRLYMLIDALVSQGLPIASPLPWWMVYFQVRRLTREEEVYEVDSMLTRVDSEAYGEIR